MKLPDPAKAKDYFAAKLAFSIGPVELDRWMKAGEKITLVDVRAAEDYAKGHLPGAIHLPKDKWDSAEGLRKDHTNVVYCYSQACHLAATAAHQFASKGWPVMELEGGFETWKEQDLEVERPTPHRFKKVTGHLLHRRS